MLVYVAYIGSEVTSLYTAERRLQSSRSLGECTALHSDVINPPQQFGNI